MVVGDIMTRKVVTIGMDDTLEKVRELFNAAWFHHLIVTENGRIVGILSDRDLLKNISPFVGHELAERRQDVATLKRRVHQIMTRQPITARADTPLEFAARLMVDFAISALPVVDDANRPIGIVTWKDILRWLADHLPELQAQRAEDAPADPPPADSRAKQAPADPSPTPK